jgi:tripartite-type tricarboxylate transporter receptor subunit TctC
MTVALSLKSFLLALNALTLFLVGTPVRADYPDKPIRVVIGYSPGGSADNLMRPVANRLSKLLGQPVIMDYKPGAGGVIAAELVARSPADGYTLHLTDSGPITIVPNLRKTSYNPRTDFTPLAMVGSGGTVILIPAKSQATSLKSLVTLMQQNPSAWSYGTSGVGGVAHLAGEQFKAASGVSINHVPYKGGALAMTDLIGGHVPVLFSSLGAAINHIDGGRVIPLAVTSANRSSSLPNVPTLAESGFAGFDSTIWFGMVGPANLPTKVMDKLVPALTAALNDAAVQADIRKEGYDTMVYTPLQMRSRIEQDLTNWGKTVKSANISLD